MDKVMTVDDAKEMVGKWEELFEVELDAENKIRLIKAVETGRLTFDEDEEVFTLFLKKPLKIGNDSELVKLTLREATVSEIQKASKRGSDFDQMIALVSAISGQPMGVIGKIKQSDILTVAAVLSFFV